MHEKGRLLMYRLMLAALVVVCGGALTAARAVEDGKQVVALEELKLDTKPLAKWGTRVFSYQLERDGKVETLGTVSMSTTVGEGGIELHDKWELNWRGERIWLDIRLQCEPGSLLRPTRISSKGKGEEAGTFSVAVGENSAVVKDRDGREKTMDVPADTLTDAAMFRIFALLPREKGFTVRVGHTLEVSELNLKGAGTIVCEGRDPVLLHQKQEELHKFVFKQGTMVVEEAWVDDKGVLRRVRINRRKILTEIRANTR
jgi:hypothetical protein